MSKELYSISLLEHDVLIDVPPTEENPTGKSAVPYGIRSAMAGCLVHPQLQLSGLQLLERYRIVEDIRNEKLDKLLLDETEYSWLKEAMEKITGFGLADYELVSRVLNAKRVEVKEDKGGS